MTTTTALTAAHGLVYLRDRDTQTVTAYRLHAYAATAPTTDHPHGTLEPVIVDDGGALVIVATVTAGGDYDVRVRPTARPVTENMRGKREATARARWESDPNR